MARSKAKSEPFDAYKNLVRPASEDLKRTLHAFIQPHSDRPSEKSAPDPDESASVFKIAAVRTISGNAVRSVFSWNEDPLALVIDISASEELFRPGIRLSANFQIVDYATNRVKKDVWSEGLRLPGGRKFSIYQGNEWHMTPKRWGLAVGLYLFRAILEIKQLDVFCLPQKNVLFRVK